MKLYAFQPRGHGQLSFFVMAENEADALAAIDAEIAKHQKDRDDYDLMWWSSFDISGWRTDYYKLTVADAGQVVTNDND